MLGLLPQKAYHPACFPRWYRTQARPHLHLKSVVGGGWRWVVVVVGVDGIVFIILVAATVL